MGKERMDEDQKCTIRGFVDSSGQPHQNGGPAPVMRNGAKNQDKHCTVRSFVNSNGQPHQNGNMVGNLEMETQNIKQNGGPVQNGGTIQNGFSEFNGEKSNKDFDSDSVEIDVTRSLTKSETIDCSKNRASLIKTIICGQILSLTLCGVGTTSTALSKWYGVRVPGFQAFLTYSCLCLTVGVRLVSKDQEIHHIIRARGWKYLILGIVDVEANFLLVKAYTFTTLTSAQLCDSFTIPTVLVLSFLFLGVRYKSLHYIGVTLCVAGAVCLIFTDTRDKNNNAKNELLGDFLSLSGAFLYGCSNVAQEFIVKEFSSVEFLGMIGIICSLLSGTQAIIVERNAIMEIEWNWHVVLLFVCFTCCQYLYYTLMPYVITLSSATVVNLSLLTADLYTLMFGLFLFGYKFSYLYFIAFGGIFAGLITYNWKPTPVAPRRTKTAKKQMEALSHDDETSKLEKQKLCENKKNGKIPFLKYTVGYHNNMAVTEV